MERYNEMEMALGGTGSLRMGEKGTRRKMQDVPVEQRQSQACMRSVSDKSRGEA